MIIIPSVLQVSGSHLNQRRAVYLASIEMTQVENLARAPAGIWTSSITQGSEQSIESASKSCLERIIAII